MDFVFFVICDNMFSYSVSDLLIVLIILKQIYIRLSFVVFYYFFFNVNKVDV